MPTLNIMYWNIENFGAGPNGKYTTSGPQVMDLITSVITRNAVSIAGFNEIRSNLGATIGAGIAARCGPTWAHAASPQFVTGRLEQYVFVYNTARVNFQATQWQFANPAPPPVWIGFPNQAASSRPPFALSVRTNTGNKHIMIAAFHGPEPGFWNACRDGNRALGRVTDFRGAGLSTCLVMGDCNVKFSADASTAGSFGDLAFTPLIVNSNFSQVPQPPDLTSLKAAAAAFPGMANDDCYSQPYDQIFHRNDAPFNTDGNREELIGECVTPAVAPYTGYLAARLRAVQNAKTGANPLAYNNTYEAFPPFRRWVSDHIPVIADVTY